jgi:hypothetical protein
MRSQGPCQEKNTNLNKPVKDREGKTIACEVGQRERWTEHLQEVLNRPPPTTIADIPPAEQLPISTNPPTKAEIIKAIKCLKNGNAAGSDGIPPETLETDPATTAVILQS